LRIKPRVAGLDTTSAEPHFGGAGGVGIPLPSLGASGRYDAAREVAEWLKAAVC
jgi:hypothetical protein